MVLLTVAGSDSGGGAGVQADLKTFGALDHHGTSVLTCITAQNTLGVQGIEPVSLEMVKKQLNSVLDDFKIDSAKTGALATPEIVRTVSNYLKNLKLVVDPVAEAAAGGELATEEAFDLIKKELIPQADVITPNLKEMESLTGEKIKDVETALNSARSFVKKFGTSVIVTGGHFSEKAVDVVVTPESEETFEGKRWKGTFHGTGCTFSAAVAAARAENKTIIESAKFAKKFTATAIKRSKKVGSGVRPVEPLNWLKRDI